MIMIVCLPGLSFSEAVGGMDERPDAARRAVQQVGQHNPSSNTVLDVWIHFPNWFSHSCTPNRS